VTEVIRTDSFFPHPPEKEDDPHQQATMRILGGGRAGHLARRLGHALATEP
jgi:hypothetical protein